MTNQDFQPDPRVQPTREQVREPVQRETPKMKHYQLTTRAQVNGGIQDPGCRFSLPEGQLGPHRTVVASNHGANVAGHPGNELVDVPLYVELDEGIENERTEQPVAQRV